jgi:hypothetical protein
MSVMQIVSLVVVALVAAYVYFPSIKWPAAKPSSMSQVEAVLAIRDSTPSPEVRKACTQLLQALLQ